MLATPGLHAQPKTPPPVASIGYVKTVAADAQVAGDGRTEQAQPGAVLHRGAVLTTGASGTIGVTLKDNSIFALGHDAELAIDNYAYSPVDGRYILVASLRRGALYYVPGDIAKADPDAVVIMTPQGRINVQSARLLVRVGVAPTTTAASNEVAELAP